MFTLEDTCRSEVAAVADRGRRAGTGRGAGTGTGRTSVAPEQKLPYSSEIRDGGVIAHVAEF